VAYVAAARDVGRGVVFITHNPHHAYGVGDRFVPLKRGTRSDSRTRDGITLDDLTRRTAGGSELDDLRHELRNRAV
jgi:simple sugar transport system ATP-binding protein